MTMIVSFFGLYYTDSWDPKPGSKALDIQGPFLEKTASLPNGTLLPWITISEEPATKEI